MHPTTLRQEIVERVIARRGRLHLFDKLDRRSTALLIIDMQNVFVAPGAPVEVPAARAIVPNVNRLAAELRHRGVPIIWVVSETAPDGSDWEMFFNLFVSAESRAKAIAALAPGSDLQNLWPELDVGAKDLRVRKNRYSALLPVPSELGNVLKERGIDTVLITGTKTNVCCESTARDAMMLDIKVAMVSDCNAALSDAEHQAALENVIQQFGDVLTTTEVLALLDGAR